MATGGEIIELARVSSTRREPWLDDGDDELLLRLIDGHLMEVNAALARACGERGDGAVTIEDRLLPARRAAVLPRDRTWSSDVRRRIALRSP
jgi:hypothetical protein